jgi:hypothetical protein
MSEYPLLKRRTIMDFYTPSEPCLMSRFALGGSSPKDQKASTCIWLFDALSRRLSDA